MTPATDIVIPIRSTRQFPIEDCLERCMQTLVEHTRNFRLILVDDASDEIGAAAIERHAKGFRNSVLVRVQFQRWFTRALNLGLRMARTQRTVALNSDVELGPGWLEELYEVWTEAEGQVGRVGLVGSVYSEPEQRRWISVREPGYVTGHCWLLQMDALAEASARRGMPGIYLDETQQITIHIRSDVFICYELNRLGWATIQSHKSQVGHAGGKSWGHRLGDINCLPLEQVSERWI